MKQFIKQKMKYRLITDVTTINMYGKFNQYDFTEMKMQMNVILLSNY